MKWSDTYRIGVPAIDEDHRRLVILAEQVISAIEAGGDPERLHDLLGQVTDLTQKHFKMEEKLLAAVGFPDLENHARLHCELLEELTELSFQAMTGQVDYAALQAFIRNWFEQHICGQDVVAFKSFFASRPA